MERVTLRTRRVVSNHSAMLSKQEYERGKSLSRNNELGEAKSAFSKSIDLNPTVDSYLGRSMIYIKQANFASAMEDILKAVDLDPDERHAENVNNIIRHIPKTSYTFFCKFYHKRGEHRLKKSIKNNIANKVILERAIYYFNLALKNDNKNADSYYKRGEAYYYCREYEKAHFDFNRALVINPNLTGARSFLIRAHAKLKTIRFNNLADRLAKDPSDEHVFSELLKFLPKSNVYFKRGLAYYNQSQFHKAIEDFTKAIEQEPKYIEALYQRGLAFKSLEKFAEANADMSKVVELTPDHTLAFETLLEIEASAESAYVKRGAAYYNAKKYSTAVEDFTTAIEKSQDEVKGKVNLYHSRGDAYFKQGMLEEAVADYTSTIALDPTLVVAYCNRGQANSMLSPDKRNDALADFTIVLELDPNDQFAFTELVKLEKSESAAYLLRGNVYRKKGNTANAIADFKKVLESDPGCLGAFDALLQLDPDTASVYYKRGVARACMGDHVLAVADFTRAIDLNSNFEDAYRSRAIAYSRTKKPFFAIADLYRAIEINPGNDTNFIELTNLKVPLEDIDCKRSSVYYKNRHFGVAIIYANHALERNPNHAEAHYYRGLGKYSQGHILDAISDLISAVNGARNIAEYRNQLKTILSNIKYNDILDKSAKAILFAALKLLDRETQVKLCYQCINSSSDLGWHMWKKDGALPCSLDSGILKEVCDHLRTMVPGFVPPVTGVFARVKSVLFRPSADSSVEAARSANFPASNQHKSIDEITHGVGL